MFIVERSVLHTEHPAEQFLPALRSEDTQSVQEGGGQDNCMMVTVTSRGHYCSPPYINQLGFITINLGN